jgi:hypothetical protein
MRARNLLFLVAALLFATGGGAQKGRPDLQPLPEPPPPPPGVSDPEPEPQVTIRKKDGDKIEEFRVGGRLVMIKVTPAHGVPYILTDSKGDGSFTNRRDSLEAPPGVPMWVLFTF